MVTIANDPSSSRFTALIVTPHSRQSDFSGSAVVALAKSKATQSYRSAVLLAELDPATQDDSANCRDRADNHASDHIDRAQQHFAILNQLIDSYSKVENVV